MRGSVPKDGMKTGHGWTFILGAHRQIQTMSRYEQPLESESLFAFHHHDGSDSPWMPAERRLKEALWIDRHTFAGGPLRAAFKRRADGKSRTVF